MQGVVGQVGIDRGSTVANQAGELVSVPGGAGFNNDIAVNAQSQSHQVMMHCPGGHQRVHRHGVFAQIPVGQHHHQLAGSHRGLGLLAHPVQRLGQVQFLVYVQVDKFVGHAEIIQRHQLAKLALGQHRGIHGDLSRIFRPGIENIALPANLGLQRHHDAFTQGIDGRIGYLGKLLPETVIKRTHPQGEHRHGRVIAHGAHRLHLRFGQHTQHLVPFLVGETELLVENCQGLGIHRLGSGRGIQQLGTQVANAGFQPFFVRVATTKQIIDTVIVQDRASARIHRQHLARTQASLADHLFGLIVVDANFRGNSDMPITGNHIAGWTQAIAIQHTGCIAPIGEHHPGRPVPGFLVSGVVLVKRTHIRVHAIHRLPGRRNENAHGLQHIHPTSDHHFQHIVQAGRIRTGGRNDGLQIR